MLLRKFRTHLCSAICILYVCMHALATQRGCVVLCNTCREASFFLGFYGIWFCHAILPLLD